MTGQLYHCRGFPRTTLRRIHIHYIQKKEEPLRRTLSRLLPPNCHAPGAGAEYEVEIRERVYLMRGQAALVISH